MKTLSVTVGFAVPLSDYEKIKSIVGEGVMSKYLRRIVCERVESDLAKKNSEKKEGLEKSNIEFS